MKKCDAHISSLDKICTRLLNADIFGQPLPADFVIDDSYWQCLPRYSHLQGVAAIVFDTLKLLPPAVKVPKEAVFSLAGQANYIKEQYQKRVEAIAALEQLTGKHYTVVKGAFLAGLYPTPCYRPSADIDLFTGAETEALTLTMSEHNILCDNKNPRHTTFMFHEVGFEAHKYLFYTQQDQELYSKWNNMQGEFSPAMQAVFLAAHTCYDALFFDMPISLRTCLDWTLMYRYLYQHQDEMEKYKKLLKGATFEYFAAVLTKYCMTSQFTLSKEIFNDFMSVSDDINLRRALSDKLTTNIFDKMFRDNRQRHRRSFVRVWRRCHKYLRYNRYYHAIFGQNMIHAFYAHNLHVALRQRLAKKQKAA
jgi:hypothetical protein